MGITPETGWKVNQMVNCEHLEVKVLDCSATLLAAILPVPHFTALVIEENKIKLLCLNCWTRALTYRQNQLNGIH